MFIWASVATRLDKLVLKTNGHKSKSYGGFESPLAHKLIEIELKRHKTIDFFKNMEKIKELNNNMSAIGRFYGVSDNAVRKWCKLYKLI